MDDTTQFMIHSYGLSILAGFGIYSMVASFSIPLAVIMTAGVGALIGTTYTDLIHNKAIKEAKK